MRITYEDANAYVTEYLEGAVVIHTVESAEDANQAQAFTIAQGVVVETGAIISAEDMNQSFMEWQETRE